MGIVGLSPSELMIIGNALNEVCHGPEAVPDPEFHTRMGGDRAEAQRVLERIQDALNSVEEQDSLT
jgi:hypothetical protein